MGEVVPASADGATNRPPLSHRGSGCDVTDLAETVASDKRFVAAARDGSSGGIAAGPEAVMAVGECSQGSSSLGSTATPTHGCAVEHNRETSPRRSITSASKG